MISIRPLMLHCSIQLKATDQCINSVCTAAEQEQSHHYISTSIYAPMRLAAGALHLQLSSLPLHWQPLSGSLCISHQAWSAPVDVTLTRRLTVSGRCCILLEVLRCLEVCQPVRRVAPSRHKAILRHQPLIGVPAAPSEILIHAMMLRCCSAR
jgi:hypothetical protein